VITLPTKALALLAAIAALVACANDPNAKYATPSRGGWDNFRAESVPPSAMIASLSGAY
jgi:hypothetical protein